MTNPPTSSDADNGIRRLVGACYLTLRTGDKSWLHHPVQQDALERSGMAGTYANLCLRHGIPTDRGTVIHGMQLSTTNKLRWESLQALLAKLGEEGIEPVLFKGGALHARWPETRDTRSLFDYDLLVPQHQLARFRDALTAHGYQSPPRSSWFTERLSKGSMVWQGSGFGYRNLDIHARVTEPPVCDSLTRSILASRERIDGTRVPDVEDCVCMIALHIVRSGMYRPLREYIDLLWYVDEMDEARWDAVSERAHRHHLTPALFLSLRQAGFCLALHELAPERAERLDRRTARLERRLSRIRRRAIDWLASPDYPLHPVAWRSHPAFRRSVVLGAGTGSAWRVAVAFLIYGASRFGDKVSGDQNSR